MVVDYRTHLANKFLTFLDRAMLISQLKVIICYWFLYLLLIQLCCLDLLRLSIYSTITDDLVGIENFTFV